MSKEYHKLLKRQLRKHRRGKPIPEEWEGFLDAVNDSYRHQDRHNSLLERSMDLSSQEMREANQQLQRKNDTLDSFVYRVSHDLKSPANNIISMVGMLKEYIDTDALSPMVLQIINHLENAGRKMKVRIDDLLEMSRMERTMHAQPERIDMTELLDDICQDLHLNIEKSKAQISVDVTACPSLLFGRENIYSIFSNLLSNAIKYSSPERRPEVTVRAFEDEHFYKIEVSDNGLGMDLQRDGSRLFGMFNRLHSHVEGTGVGLYIVKKIIESQGGRIEVRSTLNVGTTFTLYLKHEDAEEKIELHPAHR